MTSLKIGLVDLDTSHPGSWAPLLRERGHEIVGVYDGGTVYPPGYASEFAERHGIGRVYRSLREMASDVDLAVLHSCNWDLHVERARPFIEAGKAVLVDKPMAGNVRDIRQWLEWERQGARITGGSSLRWCKEAAEWRAHHAGITGIVHALAGCSVDEFHYGIHAYSLLLGIMGPGIESVRFLGSHVQRRVELRWEDGRSGEVVVGRTAGYLPMYATIVTERDVSHFTVDNGALYGALLDAVLPYLAGEAPAPLPLRSLLEAELAAIAARVSWRAGGAEVRLDRIPADDEGYDGSRFAAEYRMQRLGARA